MCFYSMLFKALSNLKRIQDVAETLDLNPNLHERYPLEQQSVWYQYLNCCSWHVT